MAKTNNYINLGNYISRNISPKIALRNEDRILIIVALLSNSDLSKDVKVKDMRHAWSKTLFKTSFNPSSIFRALANGWISSTDKGVYRITEIGLSYLNDTLVMTPSEINAGSYELYLFKQNTQYSFQKFITEIIRSADNIYLIEPYPGNQELLDDILDYSSAQCQIRLITNINNCHTKFKSAAKTFINERSPVVQIRTLSNIHDRLIIADI